MEHEIVHREWLDDYNYLLVIDMPAHEPNRYAWSIQYFNEDGEYYGRGTNGQWHDSIASALADARIHYLTEIKL